MIMMESRKIATWRIQYVSTRSTNGAVQSDRELDLELYHKLGKEFSNFLNLVQDEEGVGNDG
jgi:hypothetical protein